ARSNYGEKAIGLAAKAPKTATKTRRTAWCHNWACYAKESAWCHNWRRIYYGSRKLLSGTNCCPRNCHIVGKRRVVNDSGMELFVDRQVLMNGVQVSVWLQNMNRLFN